MGITYVQFAVAILTAECDTARAMCWQRPHLQLGAERTVAPQRLGQVQAGLRVDAEIGARRIDERVRDTIIDGIEPRRSRTSITLKRPQVAYRNIRWNK